MSTRAWQDRIVGDRMTVDQEFTDTVEQSQFSRQQWGLIMTAVEFEIHHSGDDAARLVANTEKLPHVMDEVDEIDSRMNSMGGSDDSGGGVMDSLRGLFGGNDGGNDEQLAAAEGLAERYAEQLQRHLEEQGKWDDISAAAHD